MAADLAVLLIGSQASAQCLELISGLRQPLGTSLTNQGNLLVSENGTVPPDTGRISIVDTSGNRRTLLDGFARRRRFRGYFAAGTSVGGYRVICTLTIFQAPLRFT